VDNEDDKKTPHHVNEGILKVIFASTSILTQSKIAGQGFDEVGREIVSPISFTSTHIVYSYSHLANVYIGPTWLAFIATHGACP